MRTIDLGLGPAGRTLIGLDEGRPTHVAFPSGAHPRLMVPRYPASAAAASVRRYPVAETGRARIALAVLATLARLGAIRLAPGSVALGGAGTFIDHIREMLSEEDLVFSVHLGPPRANRKPVLHLMTPEGHSVAYAKLGIDEFTSRRVRGEAQALRRLGEASTPGLIAPRLVAAGSWRDLEYLIMQPLDHESLTTPSLGFRERALESLVAAFPVATHALGQADWYIRATDELQLRQDSEEAERLSRIAQELLHSHADRRMVVGAAHGDWSRWNMSARASETIVWDWERFSIDTPLGWDELHFALGVHPGGPAAALASGRVRARILGEELSQEDAKALLAAYLFHRGVSRLLDREETGVRNAALADWLLPALEELLGLPADT